MNLASLVLAAAEEEHNPLFPAPFEIFWSLVALALIFGVFFKFVLPKLLGTLDERAELIEGGISKAAEAQAEAAAALEEYTPRRLPDTTPREAAGFFFLDGLQSGPGQQPLFLEHGIGHRGK